MKHEDFHRAGSRTRSSPRTIVRGSGCFTSVAPTFAFAVPTRAGKWIRIRVATARGPALQAKPFFVGHLAGPTADPLPSKWLWHGPSPPPPFTDQAPRPSRPRARGPLA